jgi:superfamily I DNA/RNA helicase
MHKQYPLDRSLRDFYRNLPISEAAKKALIVPDTLTADHVAALVALATYGHVIRHNVTVRHDFTPVVTASAVIAVCEMLTQDGIFDWLAEIGGRAPGGAKARRLLAMQGGAHTAWGKSEAVMVLFTYVASKRPAVVRDIATRLPSFRAWRELLVDIDAAEVYDPSTLSELVSLMRRVRAGTESPEVKRVIDAIGRESVLEFNGTPTGVSDPAVLTARADDGAALGDYVARLLDTGMSGEDATKHAEAFIRAVHNRDVPWLITAMNGQSGLPGAPMLAGYARDTWSKMTGLELGYDPRHMQRDLEAWAKSTQISASPNTPPESVAPPAPLPAASPSVPAVTADDRFRAKYGVNDEQAAIVTDRSPFVVVPAAAGSGKTRTVTTKIKYLIEEAGVRPQDIRIVAFNRHASVEIASRLRTLIGHDNTKSVKPMTTHGFASEYGFLTSTDIDATVKPSGKPRIRVGKDTVYLPSQPDLVKAAYREAVERANIKPGEIGMNMRTLMRFIDNYKNFGLTLTEYMRQFLPQRDDERVRFLMLGTLLYEEQKGYTNRERQRYGAEYDRLASVFMAEPKNSETESAWRRVVNTSLGDGALTIRHDLTDWVAEMYEAVTPKEYDDARTVAGKEARLRRLQEQHKVLIVDESQDLAPVQVLLYRAIGMNRNTPGAQYIRVGDDSQSIYGFRGATPEEFVADANQPGASQLTISHNYRSYAEIVSAADLLVNNNQVQIPKRTVAARGAGGRIAAFQTGTFDGIVSTVADRIESRLAGTGGQYLDPVSKRPLFAITCRTRRELDEFEDELAIRDITYVRKGGSPFWLKGDVGGVVRLMAAAYCYAGRIAIPQRDQLEILSKIIQWPFRPGAPKTGDVIFYAPFAKSPNPIQALKEVNKLGDVYYDRVKGGGRTNYDHFPTFVALRNDLERIISRSPNLNDMLMAILEGESRGYDGDSVADLLVKSTMTAADDDVEDADDDVADATDSGPSRSGGVAVFDKIARFAERQGLTDNPQGLIEAIRSRVEASRVIESRVQAGDQEAIPAVVLSTIHMTKGLEFENVFMVANANNFPAPVRDTDALLVSPSRVAQYTGGLAQLKMEEERRLAYVAMTRAISNLEVYTSRATVNGKETEPSQFIAEAGIVLGDLPTSPIGEAVVPEVLPPLSESALSLAASLGF